MFMDTAGLWIVLVFDAEGYLLCGLPLFDWLTTCLLHAN